jgi:hypothetical protein
MLSHYYITDIPLYHPTVSLRPKSVYSAADRLNMSPIATSSQTVVIVLNCKGRNVAWFLRALEYMNLPRSHLQSQTRSDDN